MHVLGQRKTKGLTTEGVEKDALVCGRDIGVDGAMVGDKRSGMPLVKRFPCLDLGKKEVKVIGLL